MAGNGKRNMFNEATRVQMPAMVHLTRIGYTYFGKITEDMAGTIYDPDTNILINVFKEQFVKLNPEHKGEAEQILKILRIIHTILLLNLPVSVTKMNSDRILLCL